jgi:hypothetical protein
MLGWVRRPAQWFLLSGCVGIAVAIALYVLGAIPYTRHSAVVASSVLCPEMILGLGLADPPTPAAIALLLAWVFGTNLVLYGIAGLLLGGARAWFGVHTSTGRHSSWLVA